MVLAAFNLDSNCYCNHLIRTQAETSPILFNELATFVSG